MSTQFIELTQASSGIKLMIQVDQICMIYFSEKERCTHVTLDKDFGVPVKETPEQIKSLITQTQIEKES
jgi:hypothetical protein